MAPEPRSPAAGSSPGGSAERLSFADRLQALKAQGRALAALHREAREKAATRLDVELGSLLDAEDDLLEALSGLRRLSPLLLLDGPQGVGKSSLANALLVAAGGASTPKPPSKPKTAEEETSPQPSASDIADAEPREEQVPEETPPPLLPVGRPGGRAGRPLLLRPPAEGGRHRCLEGRPSLREGGDDESRLRLLSEEDFAERCRAGSRLSESTEEGEGQGGVGDQLPLIFEDCRAADAWGSSLWLAEVDVEDPLFAGSHWIDGCSDAVCMVRAAGGGAISLADEQRVQRHLDAGRSVLLLINQCDVELEPRIPPLHEVEATLLRSLGSERLEATHALSVLKALASQRGEAAEANEEACVWAAAWESCRAGICSFAAAAEARRLEAAAGQLSEAREAFVTWCTRGTKVVMAASSQFQADAEDVRLARDLITQNIDAAYLAHAFSSVLVGQLSALCARLERAPPPDLQGRWGRRSTRQAMEASLRERLEEGLRQAMGESLEAVTAELSKQEQPCLETIRRVARRGASLPWDAEVRRLELDLRPDQLQDFAKQFFGSLSVGVLSGLGAVALEAIIGELALGPVGLVAGVATFVAVGVTNADWPSVRHDFVQKARARDLELVKKACAQLDFPGLCERRKRRLLEQMDVVLQRLLGEVAALSEAAGEFARCALVLQQRHAE